MAEVRIHEGVFEKFPGFRRGIVVAKSIQNQGYSGRLETMLAEAVRGAADQPLDLKADPRITVWQEAHRAFGSNPNKFPPAHISLLKRVQKPGAQIPFISKVVAVMNDNSIRSAMPVGGDDLMRAGETLELRFADGSEVFTPLNNPDKMEHPDAGEIIYVVPETGEVMCRRWNWRNGFKTRITEDTGAIVMNIDGLGEGCETRCIDTRDRVARMLEEFCSAETDTALLSPSQSSYRFDV